MDTHSKERLTGAVILVAAVVLLVPELLSGPGRSAPAAVEAETESLRSYTIDLAESQTRPPPVTAPVPLARAREPAEPTPSPPQDAAADAEQPGTGEPPTPERASTPPAESKTAAAETAPATPTPTPAAGDAGWFVQVGSFASRENAQRLTRELKAKGFAAAVSRSTSGRRLYRVRVGPEPDREAAQALAERLRAAGQTGSIVSHP